MLDGKVIEFELPQHANPTPTTNTYPGILEKVYVEMKSKTPRFCGSIFPKTKRPIPLPLRSNSGIINYGHLSTITNMIFLAANSSVNYFTKTKRLVKSGGIAITTFIPVKR